VTPAVGVYTVRLNKTLQIQLNGEPREVESDTSLPQLIASLDLKPEQVAIELNREVVRRAEWGSTLLQAGDKVEIVHFVGGGSRREDTNGVVS
jgi:sulfur carrier protein